MKIKEGIKIVKFGASWCAPCKALSPIWTELTRTSEIDMIEIDVDTEQEIVSDYGVRAVPTVMLLSNGVVVDKLSGPSVTKQSILNLIEQGKGMFITEDLKSKKDDGVDWL